MDKLALQFFPYPHVLAGERRDGLEVAWPAKCVRCPSRDCESGPVGDLKQCRFGVNYHRVSDELLIAGVVIRNYRPETEAGRKMLRTVKRNAVDITAYRRVVERCRTSTAELAEEMAKRRDRVMSEYRKTRGYQQEILDLLRPDIQRAFANVHDYKQFVQQVRQNMEVLLQSRTQAPEITDIAELVEKASHEEKAIYWAAVMMDERLDAALLVLEPGRIASRTRWRRIRLHGLVTKYAKIYQRRIENKHLHLRELGESYAELEGDPAAVTIIPHALIDNATKYAPEGGDITLTFKEGEGRVGFSVTSDGPKIEDHERERIFDVFFQASAAKECAPEGTGFGLGAAQLVAKQLGTGITVAQEPGQKPNGLYRTEFGVTFMIAPDRQANLGARPKRRRR
jgi:signal transduction histidine kinase